MKKLFAILAVSFSCILAAAQPSPVFNRAPLEENSFAALPLGQIEPEGWLLDQLQRMRDGLTGHLDEIYANCVGDRNAWLGGDGDTWERGPYWIDGLLPLAYILKDKDLIAKSKKWTDAIMASVHPDGNFGNTVVRPKEEGIQRDSPLDWWPRMIVVKILKQYYEATGDERAIEVLKGYFRFQLASLPENPIGKWGWIATWRASDNLGVVYWLYNICGEPFLLELGELIVSQSQPSTDFYYDPCAITTNNKVHCVNLGQSLKGPVLHWQYSHDQREKDAPRKALDAIRHTIGYPTGLWAGDETLHFGDPTCGSELCTAVETMFSAEEILKATGDTYWADYLERIAFNALPTQARDEYDSRQYFQQLNQIACTYQERYFATPHHGTDNVFGTLSGYACCFCNMHQGWPKFTANLWYASRDGGVAALVYAPCTVNATVGNGTAVRIKEETFYPFREDIVFTVDFPGKKVREASFPLYLRIPAWCAEASISLAGGETLKAEAGSTVRLDRRWKKGEKLTLHLPMKVETSRWFDGTTVVERGPLVYALKMDETWKLKEFPEEARKTYGDYYWEVTSDTPWNYCFSLKAIAKPDCFTVEELPVGGAYPWNVANAPVRILAKANWLPEWKEYNGNTGPVCYWFNNRKTGPAMGDEVTIELIPYGCTTLRICEFPTRH